MKLNAFIITGFICSNKYIKYIYMEQITNNKYMKQKVLIHHSWIFPTLQRGWRFEFRLFCKKWGKANLFAKKEEVGKVVGE